MTFDNYWKIYLREHSNYTNRFLHRFGLLLGVLSFLVFAYNVIHHNLTPLIFIASPVLTYLTNWVGHFVFQKNRPLSFKYPVESFIAYFKLVSTWEEELQQQLKDMGIQT